jgi:hypothetical protein
MFLAGIQTCVTLDWCVAQFRLRRQATNNDSGFFVWHHSVIPAGFWRESSRAIIPGFPPKACGNDDLTV